MLHVDKRPKNNIERVVELIETMSETSSLKIEKFTTNEFIYHSGDEARCVYFVQSGMVKLVTHLACGKSRIVRLHRSGDIIGFDNLSDDEYQHSAIALNSISLIKISLNSIRELEKFHPQHYCKILNQIYEHLKLADIWITEFSTGSIRSRMSHLLHFLSNIEFGKQSEYVELLKVEEIAEVLGVTPESTSRILAEFKRKNILEKLTDTQAAKLPDDLYRINHKKLKREAA